MTGQPLKLTRSPRSQLVNRPSWKRLFSRSVLTGNSRVLPRQSSATGVVIRTIAATRTVCPIGATDVIGSFAICPSIKKLRETDSEIIQLHME